MSKLKSLIPNLITAGNLVGGVLAIIFSLTGHLEWAPYCIFISAFLDFFDGFAARLLKVQSEMGKQLDSLADMVTFGVAPGVIVFVMLDGINILTLNSILLNHTNELFRDSGLISAIHTSNEVIFGLEESHLPGWHKIISSPLQAKLPFVALILPVFAMWRLGKFNLDTRQSDSFIGVPTPAMTLFFATIPLIAQTDSFGTPDFLRVISYYMLNQWFLIGAVIIFSFLMIAELPLFALKFKTFGWKGNEIRYIFLTLCAVMFATLLWLAIPLIIILYILLSIIQNLLLRKKATADKL